MNNSKNVFSQGIKVSELDSKVLSFFKETTGNSIAILRHYLNIGDELYCSFLRSDENTYFIWPAIKTQIDIEDAVAFFAINGINIDEVYLSPLELARYNDKNKISITL